MAILCWAAKNSFRGTHKFSSLFSFLCLIFTSLDPDPNPDPYPQIHFNPDPNKRFLLVSAALSFVGCWKERNLWTSPS